jgi:hypothetical protein
VHQPLCNNMILRDENIGHHLVKQITRKHVVQMIGKRAATSSAANDVLKRLKILMHFAVGNGWRCDDPTVRVKSFTALTEAACATFISDTIA